MKDPPVRLCCGQAHWGAQCPDGLVMCCICFHRFGLEDLYFDGQDRWDMCVPCGDANAAGRSG